MLLGPLHHLLVFEEQARCGERGQAAFANRLQENEGRPSSAPQSGGENRCVQNDRERTSHRMSRQRRTRPPPWRAGRVGLSAEQALLGSIRTLPEPRWAGLSQGHDPSRGRAAARNRRAGAEAPSQSLSTGRPGYHATPRVKERCAQVLDPPGPRRGRPGTPSTIRWIRSVS
jgi:hypothetical protein